MKVNSPVEAVTQVLSSFGIAVTNILVMELIDAVRDTTPPPREVTIGMLAMILKSLDPASALEGWACRSSREIVKILSELPEVKRIAELHDDERMWCTLEGVISAMLIRVTRGQDLKE